MGTGTGFLAVEAEIAALSEERSRGDAFERVVAHFLRRDPTLDIRRVWTWLDWPGRGAAGIGPIDLGIDLVAENADGRVVGVQVKFRRDPDRLIRWDDVATAVGYRRGLVRGCGSPPGCMVPSMLLESLLGRAFSRDQA